jgi:hypothetical protein
MSPMPPASRLRKFNARIKSIIFGLRTPSDHVRTIGTILQHDPGVEFYRMEQLPGRIEVRPRLIDINSGTIT